MPAREQLHERHCRFFLTLAEKVKEGPLSADAPPEWLEELDAVAPDLRHAMSWAIGSRHDQYAVDLAGSLGWYWHLRRRYTEAIHWLQLLQLDSGDITLQSRIRALRYTAHHLTNNLSGGADDFPRALTAAQQGLDLARQTGDVDQIAACLHQVGMLGVLRGDSEAVAVLQEGLAIAKTAGNAWRQVMIRTMLAHHFHHAGRIDEDPQATETATALWEENLVAARQLGDDRTVAMTLGFLSRIARRHDPEEARRLSEESLAIGRRLDDHGALNNALTFLGDANYLLGDFEAAKAAEKELAELTWHTLGEEDEMVYLAVGIIEYAEGNLAAARQELRRALQLMNPVPATVWGALDLRRGLWGLGRVLAREDRLREAAVLFAAVESADRARPPWIDEVLEAADYRQCIDLIRVGLDTETREQAKDRGKIMTVEEAVEYGLGIPSPAPETPTTP